MLSHLSANELQLVTDYNKCQRLFGQCSLPEELPQEYQFALRLREHNWNYGNSNDGEAARQGRRNEEALIAEIDSSELSDEIKTKFLNLFSTSSEGVEKALAEYNWLRAIPYCNEGFEAKGKIGLYIRGVTDDQFQKFKDLFEKFEALTTAVVKAKGAGRLIMTDDCIDYAQVRERAVQDLKDKKGSFYFGIALSDDVQLMMDRIIRNEKKTFIEMVESGAAEVLFSHFTVEMGQPNDAWLVRLSTSFRIEDSIGFFFNKKNSKERRQWKPRTPEGFLPPGVEVDRRQTAIPVINERRKIAPALSSKPMEIKERTKAPAKQPKKAPTKRRGGSFVSLHELKQQQSQPQS